MALEISDEDEIDLFALLGILWQKKLTIFIFTLSSFLLGLLIVARSPDIYRAQAILIPPAPSDLKDINLVAASGLSPELSIITPQYAFLLGLMQLDSPRKPGFVDAPSSESTDGHIANQRVQITVSKPSALVLFNQLRAYNTTDIDYAEITLTHSNKEYARAELELLILEANREAISLLTEDIDTKLMAYSALLKSKLDLAVSIQENNPREYLAELITSLQIDLDSLDKYVGRNFSSSHLYLLKDSVEVPEEPFRPKKKQIIALSLMSGFFIGIFFVLILILPGNRNSRASPKTL